MTVSSGFMNGTPSLDAGGQPSTVAVGRYGLHALRHACASLWIEQGHNPKQIPTLMGHSSIKVTSIPTATCSPTLKPTSGPLKGWNSACSRILLGSPINRRLVDVRLDTLPQDQPWSRIAKVIQCRRRRPEMQRAWAGALKVKPADVNRLAQ